MYWSAAQYFERVAQAPSTCLAAPLVDVPLGDGPLTWIGGAVGGLFSVRAIGKAIMEAGERRKKQREFWEGILSSDELRSHRVVCGGRRSDFADQVRGTVHAKAFGPLLEMLVPCVLQAFQPVQSATLFVEGLGLGDKSDEITTLGALVAKFLVASTNSPVRFLHRMGNAEPRLLLPFGGHVSNSLVEEQLRTTQDLRTFRVVAISSKGAVVRNLTSVEELAAIRRYKAVITLGMSHAEEHVPPDESIRYEIWSGDGPTAQPHAESSASGRATDYVYVVLSRVQSDEAILSVQSLHPGLPHVAFLFACRDTR